MVSSAACRPKKQRTIHVRRCFIPILVDAAHALSPFKREYLHTLVRFLHNIRTLTFQHRSTVLMTPGDSDFRPQADDSAGLDVPCFANKGTLLNTAFQALGACKQRRSGDQMWICEGKRMSVWARVSHKRVTCHHWSTKRAKPACIFAPRRTLACRRGRH